MIYNVLFGLMLAAQSDADEVYTLSSGNVEISVSESQGFTVSNSGSLVTVQLSLDCEPTAALPDGSGISRDCDDSTEYWEETDGGVEHLIALYDPSASSVTVNTSPLIPIVASSTEIALVDDLGEVQFRYSGLFVLDAFSVEVPAHFVAFTDHFEIIIDGADATYPLLVDPIVTAATSRVPTSVVPGDRFAAWFAGGDVDNDGFEDVATYSLTAREAFVYRGGSTGISATELGPFAPADMIALADVDGDGLDELAMLDTTGGTSNEGLVHIRHWNSATNTFNATDIVTLETNLAGCLPIDLARVNANGGPDDLVAVCTAGRFFAWYGQSASGPTVAPNFDSLTSIGTSLTGSSAFNLNGDAFDDFAIPGTGTVRIYKGSATGFSTAAAARATVTVSATTTLKASAVDVNNDGLDDLVVGQPAFNSNQGRWMVFTNAAGVVDSTIDIGPILPITGNSFLGGAILGDDINGDGFDDMVIEEFVSGLLVHKVFRGTPLGLDFAGALGSTLAEPSPNGFQVAFVDFNNDSYKDLVLGTNGINANSGVLRVYPGLVANLDSANFASPRRLTTPPVSPGGNISSFGSVTAIADVDMDGYDDVLIGAPSYNSGSGAKGAVFLYRGGPSGLPTSPDWVAEGLNSGDEFGDSIAVGRFRGMIGYPPVIAIGSPGAEDPTFTNNGLVKLWFAPSGGLPTSFAAPDLVLHGANTGDEFGSSVANAGDALQTSSAVGETLVVGAPQPTKSPAISAGGYISLFRGLSGGVSPVGSITAGSIGANCTSGSFGAAVAGVGDVDTAFRGDILVGGPDCSSGQAGEGLAFLFTSNVGPSVSLSTWNFQTDEVGAAFGRAVAGIGDFNDDGFPDFAIGAPLMDNGAVIDAGRVYVFAGNSGTPVNTKMISMSTSTAGNCGSSIAGGFDINGDGIADFIEGEPSNDTSFTNQGRVRGFFGAIVVDAVAEVEIGGGCTNCKLGSAIAGGNVNGEGTFNTRKDSYADVALGRPGITFGSGYTGDVLVRVGKW